MDFNRIFMNNYYYYYYYIKYIIIEKEIIKIQITIYNSIWELCEN